MRRTSFQALFLLAAGVGFGLFAGCGPDTIEAGGGGGVGAICYVDSDCVPDGCCGTATAVTDKSSAPNCASQTCSNSCPVDQVQCGCGIPVCKDSHCAIAYTTGGTCTG